MRLFTLVLAGCVSLASNSFAQQSSSQPTVTPVRGALYKVQEGREFTVFLVTSQGIVVADPLSTPTALWLEREFARWFPDLPVRYVLQTDHHFQRAGGAWVFNETAEIVGHETFNDALSKERTLVPPLFASLDANSNRAFEAAEIANLSSREILTSRDRNQDGRVTPVELYSDVRRVESTYEWHRTIALGESRVELVHPSDAHATDLTVLYFPAERIVFAGDYVPNVKSPIEFAPDVPREVIAWVRTVAALDFDVLLSGSGELYTKATLLALDRYLLDLDLGVRDGIAAHRTAEELDAGLTLNAHRGTINYVRRREHIGELFRSLHLRTTMAYGSLSISGLRPDDSCSGADVISCQTSGATALSGLAGGGITVNRFGVQVEMIRRATYTSERRTASISAAGEYRDTMWSALARYEAVRTNRLTMAGSAGPSLVFIKRKSTGIYQNAPFQLSSNDTSLGWTAGLDNTIAVSSRLSVLLPLRIAFVERYRDAGVRHVYVEAGAGLALTLSRRIY